MAAVNNKALNKRMGGEGEHKPPVTTKPHQLENRLRVQVRQTQTIRLFYKKD